MPPQQPCFCGMGLSPLLVKMQKPFVIIGVIFSALFVGILFCFVITSFCSSDTPEEYIDSSPYDFGGMPEIAGYGYLEEITDCTGDTDLLTLDEIDWSRSTDGWIVIRTTPSQHVFMTSKVVWEGGESYGTAHRRGLMGYAEKKVGGRWKSVGEIYVYLANNAGPMQSSGNNSARRWCSISPEDPRGFKDIRVELPEYEYGATYRITYFFLKGDEDGYPYGGINSIRHTVTLPQKTNKRLDFVSLGWEDTHSTTVYPEIRVNHGEAPYLSLYDCTLEHKQDGQWVKSTRKGKSAFFISPYVGGIVPVVELEPCENLANHYRLPNRYSLLLHDLDDADAGTPPTDFRLTLVFCDNADGSGERYTLTLYLNTELLSEYR